MKEVRRNYLDRLISVIGTPDIKVITGVRRSGKSFLLREFQRYLETSYPNSVITSIDFSSIHSEKFREYHALHTYIESRYQPGKRNFVLIDEVQMCPNFELAINSLHAQGKYDLYVTGSNAFLDHNKLATLFVGRTFTIEIFPFSFKEYMDYFNYSTDMGQQYKAFTEYLSMGGFAGSYAYNTEEERRHYVADIFNTLIIRDIEQKYDFKNPAVMERLCDYMADNISHITSVRKITSSLHSEHLEATDKTIGTYLGYLCNAYAFYRVHRYDIKGRRYLSTNDKYYLSDHAFKYARLGTKDKDYGSILENIVAIELLRRGYEIYVGTFRNGEIDFVAKKFDEQIYIQVSYYLDDPKTLERELAPFRSLKDAYPRYIISRTYQPAYTHDGIHIIDIADWLLSNPNSQGLPALLQ